VENTSKRKSSGSASPQNNGPAGRRLTPILSQLVNQAQANPDSLTTDEIQFLQLTLGNQQTQSLLNNEQHHMSEQAQAEGQGQGAGQAQVGEQAQNSEIPLNQDEDWETGVLQQLDIDTLLQELEMSHAQTSQEAMPTAIHNDDEEDDILALLNELNIGVSPINYDDNWMTSAQNETSSVQASGGTNVFGSQNSNHRGIAAVRAGRSAFAQLDGEFTELTADPGLGYCTAVVVWGDDWCAMAHLPAGDPGQLDDGGEAIQGMAQYPGVSGIYLIIGVSNAQSIVDYAAAIENGLMLMGGNIDVCPGTAMDLTLNANGQYLMGGGISDEQLRKLLKPQLLAKLKQNQEFAERYPYFMAWATDNGWFNEKS
jgi:hypothetical protein